MLSILLQGEGLFGRMGGKNLLKKRLVDDYFPEGYEEMTYIEPFVGGGSIYFYKEPSKKEIINDLDKTVYTIYKGFQKYDPDKINKDVKGKYTKDEFKNILDYKPKGDYQKFIRTYILTRLSFFGQGRTYNNKGNITKTISTPEHLRLKTTKILNKDYKYLISKYDGPNSFFYLDPPYEGSGLEHYEHTEIDYNEMAKILSHIKGMFLMSINKSENIKNLFKDFNIREIKTKYTDPLKGGQSRLKTEYLISNY